MARDGSIFPGAGTFGQGGAVAGGRESAGEEGGGRRWRGSEEDGKARVLRDLQAARAVGAVGCMVDTRRARPGTSAGLGMIDGR